MNIKKYKETIILSSVCLGLIVLGFAVILWGNRHIQFAKNSEKWPTVTGKIINYRIDEVHNTRSNYFDYHPYILYYYEISGSKYRNELVRFGPRLEGRKICNQLKEVYKPGTEVEIFYNPKDPSISCLMPGSVNLFAYLVYPFGLLFIVFGVFLLYMHIKKDLLGKKTI